VLTLDRGQVEQLTGVTLDAGDQTAVIDAVASLGEDATWSPYPETKDHVGAITGAADRESDRLYGILTAESDGKDVGLRLFIEHGGDAHFNGNYDD
jgi:hypothetical protein